MPSVPSTTVSLRAHSGRARSAGAHQVMSSRPSAPPAKRERERRHVLADGPPPNRPRVAETVWTLAEQEPGGIDQVTAHVQQDQPGHRREVGLVGEAVGRKARVSRCAIRRRIGRPIVPGVDLGTERAVPGPEPPVLVDHQADAGRVAVVDHRQEIGPDRAPPASGRGRARHAGRPDRPARRCDSGRVQISTKSRSGSPAKNIAASV